MKYHCNTTGFNSFSIITLPLILPELPMWLIPLFRMWLSLTQRSWTRIFEFMAYLLKNQLHCIAPGNSYWAGLQVPDTHTEPRVWDPLGATSMPSCSAEPELSVNSEAKSSRRTFILLWVMEQLFLFTMCTAQLQERQTWGCRCKAGKQQFKGPALFQSKFPDVNACSLLVQNQSVWILKLQHPAFLFPQLLFLPAACISLQ